MNITYFVHHSSFSAKRNQGNRKLFYQIMSVQPSTDLKQCEKKRKKTKNETKSIRKGKWHWTALCFISLWQFTASINVSWLNFVRFLFFFLFLFRLLPFLHLLFLHCPKCHFESLLFSSFLMLIFFSISALFFNHAVFIEYYSMHKRVQNKDKKQKISN